MKKLQAAALAGVMALGTLMTAAPAMAESEGPDFSEHMDITVAYWDVESALTGTENDEVLATLEEKLNITLIPQNISWDDYEQKLQLWAASDSLPDIFMGAARTTSSFAKWANEGLLKQIPDDLSAYPSLEAYLDDPELSTCQIGGKTFCIFRKSYQEQAATSIDRPIVYRWDLAQEAGVEKEPETWEEFHDMIQKIIEADPEGKNIQGMTAKGPRLLAGVFVPYTMQLGAVSGVTFYWTQQEDGSYVPAYFAGEELGADALPMWKMVREFYEDGTIEKDIAVNTSSQAGEKFLQGANAAIVYDGGTANIYSDVGKYWQDVYGVEFLEDCRFLNLMQDINGNPTYPVWDYAWSESYISSHVDDAKLERILALYDYLLSDEGSILTTAGIEGKTFEYDENGAISYAICDNDPGAVFNSIRTLAYLAAWTDGKPNAEIYPNTLPEPYVEIRNSLIEQARQIEVQPYNYDCTNVFIGLESDFALTVDDDLINIMTGTDDVEDMWAQIIDDYKFDGLEDIIEDVNAAMAE